MLFRLSALKKPLSGANCVFLQSPYDTTSPFRSIVVVVVLTFSCFMWADSITDYKKYITSHAGRAIIGQTVAASLAPSD